MVPATHRHLTRTIAQAAVVPAPLHSAAMDCCIVDDDYQHWSVPDQWDLIKASLNDSDYQR